MIELVRKAAEVEAEAARWFFQNSDDVFVVMRRGVIDWVNPAWTKLTGWTREETVGRPLTDFAHPEDAEVIGEAIRSLQTTGQSSAEHRMRTRNDGWVWLRSRSIRPAEGAALVVSQDITEERRRLAEREITLRANELLRAAAGIFAWRLDPDTGVFSVDPELSRPMMPGSPATVAADGTRTLDRETMRAQVHPDDREALIVAIAHSVETGEQQIVTYRQRNPEGPAWATLRAAWRGVRQRPSGKWEVFGITHDMTEVALARDAAVKGERAAQAAVETKARFLANMSHEIRTPMNGVLGVLHLLKREELSQNGRELLDEALGCGSMLAELLNDIIDFSKIEAGRMDLSPAPVDPAAVLTSVAEMLRVEAEAKGLYLNTLAAADIGWVEMDAVRLRQVLFNLIGNAVKFTLAGGVEAHLTARGEDAGRRLQIEVKDTGIGIPLEAQASLFERFHQGDGSTTRRFGGSGLGLAITQRLAAMMDGAVSFESREGKGSVFRVELAAPACVPPAGVEEAGATVLEGLRVLVVEDNSTNRLIATRMLEHLGAHVVTAANGLEGAEAAGRTDFDLIFMDVQMPVMDGIEATRRIRAEAEPAGRTPIIAMTANAMAHQLAAYLAAGMNGALAKPLSPAALLAEIAAVLDANTEPGSAVA